jgi:hypothetical protein
MSSIETVLEQALGVVLLAIAVILVIAGTRRLTNLAKVVASGGAGDADLAYESAADPVVTPDEVTYSDLIVLLSTRLQNDIVIDGTAISADTYTPALISNYAFPVFSHYRQSLHFDTDGNISYVEYNGY